MLKNYKMNDFKLGEVVKVRAFFAADHYYGIVSSDNRYAGGIAINCGGITLSLAYAIGAELIRKVPYSQQLLIKIQRAY